MSGINIVEKCYMNLNSDIWCNLIFEGKNKEYGAYYLRKTSSTRHIYALIITIGIIGVLILPLYIWKSSKTSDIEIKPVNLSELSMVEYVYLENPERPKTEVTNTEKETKNTPPKIVTDEEDIPELVDQTEIRQIQADSTDIASVDSTLLAGHKLRVSEILDDPVTYVLNPTDSGEKSSSLQTSILRYVYHNLKYPDAAYQQRIKGKVIYSFVVNKDGSISDITLVKGIYIFLDEEVLRVIHSMPALEPEKKDGKPIRVKCYLPVVFSS